MGRGRKRRLGLKKSSKQVRGEEEVTKSCPPRKGKVNGKVALTMYGFLRNFEQVAKHNKKFFSDHNVDVFIYAPNTRNDPQAQCNTAKQEIIDEDIVRKVYGPSVVPNKRDYVVRPGPGILKMINIWDYDFSMFEEKAASENLPAFNKKLIPCERFFSLFYHMQNAMQLPVSYAQKQGFEYDWIFVTRPDVWISGFKGFESLDPDVITTISKRPVVKYQTRFDDRLFVGSMKNIELVSKPYQDLDQYLNEEKLLFIPEDIMCHHCRSKGVMTKNSNFMSPDLLSKNNRNAHNYTHLTGVKLSTRGVSEKIKVKLIKDVFKDDPDVESGDRILQEYTDGLDANNKKLWR